MDLTNAADARFQAPAWWALERAVMGLGLGTLEIADIRITAIASIDPPAMGCRVQNPRHAPRRLFTPAVRLSRRDRDRHSVHLLNIHKYVATPVKT